MNKVLKIWDDFLGTLIRLSQINSPHIRQRFIFNKRISTKEQIIFFKRLSMMLRAQLPITDSLEIIAFEQKRNTFSQIVQEVLKSVSSGQTLSVALSQQNNLSNFSLSIIAIGETSGTLADNLDYLAVELKKKQEIKKQIIGSLIYPIIVVVATLLITIFLIVSIFPKIVPIFLSVEATLPWSTTFLMLVSDFLITYGWYAFGALLATLFVAPSLLRVPKIKYVAALFTLALPVVGKLSKYYVLAQVFRTLSLLLNSGVNILVAFDITNKSIGNVVYRQMLEIIKKEIVTGTSIATELQKSPRLFPIMVVQMIKVGEKTGNISATFSYLSDFYEAEIKDITKNLTTILEPVLMLFMGLLVGFIAISIIAPIYGITQNL